MNLDVAATKFAQIGVHLHRIEKLHSKIVAVDDNLLSIGSFNWLSASRKGVFARHETSFVYQGPHLESEINMILGSLKKRQKQSQQRISS